MRSLQEIKVEYNNNNIRDLKPQELYKSDIASGILSVCTLAAKEKNKLQQVPFHLLNEKCFKTFNENGRNLLGEACVRGYSESILWENLKHSAWNVNDTHKKNGLHYALENAQAFRIEWKDTKQTALAMAQRDRSGKTPIDYAQPEDLPFIPSAYKGTGKFPETSQNIDNYRFNYKNAQPWDFTNPPNRPRIFEYVGSKKVIDWNRDLILRYLHVRNSYGNTLLEKLIRSCGYSQSEELTEFLHKTINIENIQWESNKKISVILLENHWRTPENWKILFNKNEEFGEIILKLKGHINSDLKHQWDTFFNKVRITLEIRNTINVALNTITEKDIQKVYEK
jgi:hypothetical protein